VVKLKDMVYGKGIGVGKKEAKLLAAKAAVEKLIPELEGKAEEIISVNLKETGNIESASDSNNVINFRIGVKIRVTYNDLNAHAVYVVDIRRDNDNRSQSVGFLLSHHRALTLRHAANVFTQVRRYIAPQVCILIERRIKCACFL
jgi:hypothetical protein